MRSNCQTKFQDVKFFGKNVRFYVLGQLKSYFVINRNVIIKPMCTWTREFERDSCNVAEPHDRECWARSASRRIDDRCISASSKVARQNNSYRCVACVNYAWKCVIKPRVLHEKIRISRRNRRNFQTGNLNCNKQAFIKDIKNPPEKINATKGKIFLENFWFGKKLVMDWYKFLVGNLVSLGLEQRVFVDNFGQVLGVDWNVTQLWIVFFEKN